MERRYLKCRELSQKRAIEIITMINSIWPPKDILSEIQYSERYIAKNENNDLILYLDSGKIFAHAMSFIREIKTDYGLMKILAIKGIAVKPEYRDKNFGKKIVLDAFSSLDTKNLNLSLFQTGVPSFYKKLGARTVKNRFINSLNSEDPQSNPWWDKEVMIYPGSAEFPDGVIDLLGSGY